MTTPVASPPARAGRVAYIDNLRIVLTLLVVAHHCALAYGNLGVWPNWQQPVSVFAALPLDLFVVFNQTFFMGLFFLLSGYFVPRVIDRKGVGSFAVGRLKRLGIPFLGYVVLLRPLYTLPTYLDMPAPQRPSFAIYYLTTWEVGPAWFLELLLIFSLAYAAVRWWRPKAGPARPRALRRRELLVAAVVLGVASYGWRMVVPLGTYEPVLGLPSPGYLPQYALFFLVGIAAYRHRWLEALPRGAGSFGALLAVMSFVPLALGGYRGLDLALTLPGYDLAHLGVALWDSLLAVGISLVLLRLFARHAGGTGRFCRYLADNAFAVYLVHAPVIVGVVALLQSSGLTPVAAFLLTLVLAAIASWAVAGTLRGVPAVRAVV